MNCVDVRKDLPERRPEAADHLQACEGCRAEADAYDRDAARLSEGFRRLAEAVPARRRPSGLWIAAAASLLILGATAAVLFPDLLPGRGTPGSAVQDPQIAGLIENLGSDDIAVRTAAMAELIKKGKSALPQLRRELEKAASEEVRGRLKEVIEQLTRPVFELVATLPRMGIVGEWRPDGKEYALADDAELAIYETRTWREIHRIDPPKDGGNYIFGLSYSPDGKILAVRHATKLCLYSVPGYREIFSTTHGGRIDHHGWDLRFLDANRFLFRPVPGAVMVFAERKGDAWVLHEKTLHESDSGQALHFDVRPDGAELAVGGTITRLLETQGWTQTDLLDPGTPGLTRIVGGLVAYSPDSRFLATDLGNLQLGIFDRPAGKEAKRLQLPRKTEFNHSFRFSGDSKHLFTGGADGKLRAWSCSTWNERASAEVGIVFQVRASPVDGTVVVGSRIEAPPGTPLDRAKVDRTLIFRLTEP